MTGRIPLATVAFAASAASAWAAVPPGVQQDWYVGVRWSVRGAAFADAKKECVLADIQARSGGLQALC